MSEMHTAPVGRSAPKGRARSVDVAQRAGVSRATVSRILNGDAASFTAETAAKVHQAAQELGYVPSAAGRTLVRGRSDVVLIVLPHITIGGVQDLVDAVSSDLEYHGLSGVVVFGRSMASDAKVARLAESLGVAGIVDLGGLSREDTELLGVRGVPVIGPAVRSHSLSNLMIGRVQAEHLIRSGKRRIVYAAAADQRGRRYDADRAEGARHACLTRGLAAPLDIEIKLDRGEIADAVDRILTEVGQPVGIACTSDDLGRGIVQAVLDRGLEVPADVAVVGIGVDPVGQLVRPQLTSVRADARSLLGSIRAALAVEFGSRQVLGEVDPNLDSIEIVPGETT